MEELIVKFSSALGWSILHSLWFGFLVYVSVLCLFYVFPKLSASAKSYFPLLGSFALFGFFISVFIKGFLTKNTELTMQLSENPLQYPYLFVNTAESRFFIEPYFPVIVSVYIIGILIEGIWLVRSYFKLDKIKTTGLSSVPHSWQILFDELTEKMGIKRKVNFQISSFVEVPMMIGYLKPFVLFPIAAVNRLDMQQVEAILIHELTHIKRNDYLLNFLKVFVETILFFNPFIWLLGSLTEKGREYACDDSVIKLNVQRKIYADALLQLELLRKKDHHPLEMAAFYTKSDLFNRIKRIITMKTNYVNRKQKLVALSVGIIGIAAIAWTQPATSPLPTHLEIKEASYLPDHAIVLPIELTQVTEAGFITASRMNEIKNKVAKDTIWNNLQDSTVQYFQSPEWKSKIAEIEKNAQSLSESAKEIAAQFNSEEWKAKIKAQVEAGESLSKEWEEKLRSPEWQAKLADIKNKAKFSEEMAKEFAEKFNSEEWQAKIKKQVKDTERMSEELKAKFNSQEWKDKIEEIKKNAKISEEQAAKLTEKFNSEEWSNLIKKQMEQVEKIKEERSNKTN
jgi:beta-lactamase regulating signal transducer with metallopeptidase domain